MAFFYKDVRVPSGLGGKYQIPTIPTNWVDNTNKTKKHGMATGNQSCTMQDWRLKWQIHSLG